jgi:hypothetical protein
LASLAVFSSRFLISSASVSLSRLGIPYTPKNLRHHDEREAGSGKVIPWEAVREPLCASGCEGC